MSCPHSDLRRQIVKIGRLAYQKGWVAANDGNISVRLGPDRILATPTGVSKGMMSAGDMIVCDMDGVKLEGSRERTSEILMHTTIYQMRPDVQAIVHAHPPVATGFAVAGRALNLALLPEVIVGLGCIPLAGYGLPGTPELSEALKPFNPRHDALLMANHGAVCYADELMKAFFRMETLEHCARVTLVAELLGGPCVLPQAEVEKLVDARGRYGVQWSNGIQPDHPLAAEQTATREPRLSLTRSELMSIVQDAISRVERRAGDSHRVD
ncbi:MAG TPA: class II aldolase/adducin family protein [Bryobacteraceae bacterium]|nr:class II aldolase/adducin family protein [Bryobacteraceae bacterium]